MIFEKLGPTGHLIEGSILDCSRKPFERALRDYDSLLYVRWNPKKNKGYGKWEVRRRPEKKSIVESYVLDDNTVLSKVEYCEQNVVNHIFDVSILNFEIIEKLKSMDTWNDKHYIDNMEYNERVRQVEAEDKARAEAVYRLKGERTVLKAWKEMILSGHNPADIAKYWK